MNYKLSRYNVLFERNGKKYLWNTFSDALIRLDASGLTYLDGFNGVDDNTDYFQILRDNGYIVDSRFDELGKVLFDEKATMLNDEPIGMHYTIAPGLGCNYNCSYCFEKDRKIHTEMTRDMQIKLCDFIINAAEKNKNLQQIGITWFGGEPLLYMDTISFISTRIMTYCRERGIRYNAGLVTNGRFLDPINAAMLQGFNVTSVQLAIDGTKDYYVRKKGALPEDFDATINNVVASSDILPITVRINVSDNYDEALKLTEYLLTNNKLDGKIQIYIAHVRDYDEEDMDKEQQSHKRFLSMEKRYFELFGKGKKYSLESLSYIKPKRRCTTCLSVCNPNYCIGPEGELYRCEHHFGKTEHIVGTIESGRFYAHDEVYYLKHLHPAKCEECQIFPVCLGGCMNDVKAGKTALSCELFRERLFDYLLMENSYTI